MKKFTMLGAGHIGAEYTMALQQVGRRDPVAVVYSRSESRAKQFAETWGVPIWTTDLIEAIQHPETEVVVISLPNDLHERAASIAADCGKAVLCTKPLGRSAAEAKRMLDRVEQAGVWHGYLEDLVYTPKTQKALSAVRNGVIGNVLWVRSRGAHGGPHSDWFLDQEHAGGGALLDMGSHCIEVGRNFIGKDVKPVEVMCWTATQVHPISAEDQAVGLVRYASGAVGQFEVSWAFRGGMDLRDEVSGSEGTIWLNHWLRTGFEIFSSSELSEYAPEKSEGRAGWFFPVSDENTAIGNTAMFSDMLDALEGPRAPKETFYDGYIVNAIIEAAYRSTKSKRWESVEIEDWRGSE